MEMYNDKAVFSFVLFFLALTSGTCRKGRIPTPLEAQFARLCIKAMTKLERQIEPLKVVYFKVDKGMTASYHFGATS